MRAGMVDRAVLLELALRMADELRPCGVTEMEWAKIREVIAGRLTRVVKVLVERPVRVSALWFVGSEIRAVQRVKIDGRLDTVEVQGIDNTSLWKHTLARLLEHGHVSETTTVFFGGRPPLRVLDLMEDLKDIL